jgi:hypothetical protein
MNGRTIGRVLGVLALALVLGGCFRVDMDVEVSPENDVSGTAVIAVDESLLQLTGQSADQLFQEMDLSDLPPGATADRYEEDGFIGQQITFSDVPLDEFQSNDTLSGGATPGEELTIERVGDEFHVNGGFDMSGEQFTGADVPQQFLDSFEFSISITFPGPISSSTGDVDGNTVTWEPKIGANTRIEAVASAIPSSSSSLPMILLIVAGVLILGAILFLVMRRRAAPAAGPIDETASGFAPPPATTTDAPEPAGDVSAQPPAPPASEPPAAPEPPTDAPEHTQPSDEHDRPPSV